MTKLWIFSDLHADLGAWIMPEVPEDVDILVAAGDIDGTATQSIRRLADMAQGRPTVFVPGNHEWYQTNAYFSVETERMRALEETAGTNVHMLMDEEVILDGIRFLGSTLWTDFALDGMPEISMRVASRSMNDYRFISPTDDGRMLQPCDTLEWHRRSRTFLEERLRRLHDRTVVVTHHVPHRKSIAERYADDVLNPAFCSDLSHLVEDGGAALWVHGHTHSSFDYMAGSTRVVCNPKGYGPRNAGGPLENGDFDPLMIVEA